MRTRWFRISFARNAFLRLLGEQGLDLGSLSPMHGIRAMTGFFAEHRPQHGERDELVATWAPADGAYEFAVRRRMQRHDQPETTLSLVFVYADRPGRPASGSAPVVTWRDVAATEGYQAVRRARPLNRRIDQG